MTREILAFSSELKSYAAHPEGLRLPAGTRFSAVDNLTRFRESIKSLGRNDVVLVDTDTATSFKVTDVVSALKASEDEPHVVVLSWQPPVDRFVCSVVTTVHGDYLPKEELEEPAEWWQKIHGLVIDRDEFRGIKAVLDATRKPLFDFAVKRSPGGAADAVEQTIDGMLADLRAGDLQLLDRDPVEVGTDRVARFLADTTGLSIGGEPVAIEPAENLGSGEALEAAPDVEPEPPGEAPAETGRAPVFWNSSFPEDRNVNASKVIVKGDTYRFRTALEAAALPSAAATSGITTPIADGEQVSFEAVSADLKLRLIDDIAKWADFVDSGALPFRAGRGTERFEFELSADEAGPCVLELRLIVRNAAAARQPIELVCVDPAAATRTGNSEPAATEIAAESISSTRAGGDLADYPEAKVRIEARPVTGEPVSLAVTGPGAIPRPYPAALGESDLIRTIISHRDRLNRQTRSYVHGPARDGLAGSTPDVLLQFAKLGTELHRGLFGFRDEVDPETAARRADAVSVARLGRGAKGGDHPRLNVVATDLPIPWALVYDDAFLDGRPLNPATVDDVDIESFWGYRFRIDRSAPVSCDLDTDRTVGGPDVALRMCINRRIDQQAAGVVALQCDALKRLTEGQRFRLVQTIDSDAALTAWLEAADSSPGCDLLYFFCHARPAVDLDRTGLTRVQPNRKQAAVLLDAVDETGSGTSVEDLWEKRRQPVPNYPLVILNACGSGQGTESGVSPFVEVFLYRWAGRGFVGTDWTIPTGFADPFGRRLLARFAEGNTTIGAALHDTVREALDAGNPFGLIYCLYGRPDLAIVRV